ncbi:uncharacterized protein LOC108155191 [Drosophila miranda]|uniref:uncharacterized protein LOC108155191 n=1 Tax=Drosophila miranda TaxID=7229 RepID=UPI0007E7C6B4|nr:uncharacterized protein LOC108155191 [Drosophila miranda]
MEVNVYDDCWLLVQRFNQAANDKQNGEFEVFCRCWQELQLQHLFSAQTNHIEIIATTLAALHVGKRVACGRRTNGQLYPAASRFQRIAGFYLLYVVYNKQPTQNFVKIEVSPSTWQSLCDYALQLRRDSPEQKDTEQVSYLFWRLVQQQAFRFTAVDYGQGLDGLVNYDNVETAAGISRQKKSELILKQHRPNKVSLIYELEDLRNLDLASDPFCKLETAYNRQKQQLVGQEQTLPPTRIFSQLREIFSDIQNIIGGQNQNQHDDEQPTTSTNHQLELRERVRYKAIYGKEKDDLPKAELDKEEEQEVQDPYQRRTSSVTIFLPQLPKDVEREYEMDDYTEDEDEEGEDCEEFMDMPKS